MDIRGFVKLLCAALACLALASCANKPEPEPEESLELDFRPLVFRWKAIVPEAEEVPFKDACVIRITSQLMREPVLVKSKGGELEYVVSYDINGEILKFDGFATDSALSGKPEYHWTATCGKDEKVVVNFHNGQ